MAKKKRIYKPVLVTVLSLAALSLVFYYMRFSKPVSFTRYPGFGIDLPVNYSIHGIDVSKYQGTISWKMVKDMHDSDAKIGFAFIKATEGLANTDPQFRRNWREAKKAGVIRGAYHFFIPSKSGKAQAEQYINKVKIVPGDFPPVLDIEEAYGTPAPVVQKNAAEWLNAVEYYYQAKPIIYTNIDFYNKYLAGKFDDYPLWIAHYKEKGQPRIRRDWLFWQHDEKGHVDGISNYVDFNVFNGDSTALYNLLVR